MLGARRQATERPVAWVAAGTCLNEPSVFSILTPYIALKSVGLALVVASISESLPNRQEGRPTTLVMYEATSAKNAF